MNKNDDIIQDEANDEAILRAAAKRAKHESVDSEEVLKETQDEIDEENVTEENPVNEWEDKYKRALADYQNLEKRVANQRRELILTSSRQVIERMLPVLDTLILAGEHVKDPGITVSIQQFSDVLKSEGVEKIDTKGKKFDPLLMEAVGTQAGDEGKVVQEARAGYIMNEKLLRPAQVIVGSGDK